MLYYVVFCINAVLCLLCILFCLGSDTQTVLPLDEWFHLSFVFRNLSAAHDSFSTTTDPNSNGNNSAKYVVSVYFNGQLDFEMSIGDDVLSSAGDLKLFYDDFNDGILL